MRRRFPFPHAGPTLPPHEGLMLRTRQLWLMETQKKGSHRSSMSCAPEEKVRCMAASKGGATEEGIGVNEHRQGVGSSVQSFSSSQHSHGGRRLRHALQQKTLSSWAQAGFANVSNERKWTSDVTSCWPHPGFYTSVFPYPMQQQQLFPRGCTQQLYRSPHIIGGACEGTLCKHASLAACNVRLVACHVRSCTRMLVHARPKWHSPDTAGQWERFNLRTSPLAWLHQSCRCSTVKAEAARGKEVVEVKT